jgi:hypothetical protein
MNVIQDLDIFVLANKKRPAIVCEYLTEIAHTVHWNPDYDWPENLPLNPELIGYACHPLNMYRCFRGHADILNKSSSKYLLVLEDDACPNIDDWFDIVKESIKLLENHEVVCLHGREFSPSDIDYKNNPSIEDITINVNNREICFSKPFPNKDSKYGITWCCGSSMAYLIKKEAKHKLTEYAYDGFPIDLFIASKFDFFVMRNSCFDHNRKFGTLMKTDYDGLP